MKISTIYRIEDGILAGTEIEPIMAFVAVKYPHRKTKDCYIPPMKANGKETKTWHCCQECQNPDFEGNLNALVEHLMLHKGRLLKMWNRKQQLKSPLPAVKLPANEWNNRPNQGVNEDRRFCVNSYINDVTRTLRRQGIQTL